MSKKSTVVAKLTKADLQSFCLHLEGWFAFWIFVGKVLNNIVLICAIKLMQQKLLEVCITWKLVGCLELYIFPG